jgi:phosphomannomutase
MTCKKGITNEKSVMNEDNGPTYDELRTKCDDLQKQVAHSLVVEQDLINIRDSLDRDLTRDNLFELIKTVETSGGKRPYCIVFSPYGDRIAVGYDDSNRIHFLSGYDLHLLNKQ